MTSKIQTLDPITTSQIAAGEVVERPASVIKELCENALDAGATVIEIEVEQGGIRSMIVRDNGSGMTAEDSLQAFLPHATSKLRDLSDLNALNTLGFRGEALPAIAAVSRMTLVTRTDDMEHGVKVSLEGGDLLEQVPEGTARGSTFEVRDLFYNTPARYKFLKTDRTEGMYITRIVTDLALARPDVSFRLSNDGKEKIHTPGNGELIAAIYALFGHDIAAEMIEIEPIQGSPVQLRGYLGKPSISRRSRQMQYFNVNARPFQSALLAKALEQGYAGQMMKHKFPVAVLHLDVSPSLIDVNVHPQKLEIRFWDDSKVFREVMHQVQGTLQHALVQAPHTADDSAVENKGQDPAMTAVSDEDKEASWSPQRLDHYAKSQLDSSAPLKERDGSSYDTSKASAAPATGQQADLRVDARQAMAGREVEGTADSQAPSQATAHSSEASSAAAGQPHQHQLFIQLKEEAKYLGQVFTTYLLFELADELVMIDQHAAHEKLLYESLMETFDTQHELTAQTLLTATSVQLSSQEIDLLQSQSDAVKALGFDIDLLGPTRVVIRAIPASRSHMDPEAALRALLDDLHNLDFNVLSRDEGKTRHLLATMACKAAVKGHDELSKIEVDALLDKLSKATDPWHCPHGRPVLIHVPQQEIEKAFQRIVN